MTNTTAHTCRGKNTSIIPYKMASTLDPLLQEIKFQNGPWLRQQNKGTWWLRVDFNNARFSTQVWSIWEMNVIISRSRKVRELNKKPQKVWSINFFTDAIWSYWSYHHPMSFDALLLCMRTHKILLWRYDCNISLLGFWPLILILHLCNHELITAYSMLCWKVT